MNRQRTELDGVWQFWPDPNQNLTERSLREEDARQIRVPGPWQAQFDDLRDYSGVAWYRRHFEVDRRTGGRDSDDAVHLLHFGAVDYFTTVWLNGQPVGEHEGGYLPFELDVTPLLRREDANELVVRVIDPGNDADFPPRIHLRRNPSRKTKLVRADRRHLAIGLSRAPLSGSSHRVCVSPPMFPASRLRFASS